MPHDIIDNLSTRLVDVLKEKLSVTKRARFVVGYLFLSGFKELRNELNNIEKLEILAGARTNKETAEALLLEKKWEKAVEDLLEKTKYLPEEKRKELLDKEYQGLLNDLSYIEPTEQNIEFLGWFLEKLKEGRIEIRTYYKEPLHAKLYLFEYKEKAHGLGEAIIGSSNFSISGFNLNTELNVRVLGDDNFNKLNAWFEKLWEESQDANFTVLAQQAIENSWAFNKEVTPFRVYLRTLHEIFSVKETAEDIESEANLFSFQKDAVIDAYRRLKKYRGVFISDVPGLGKTYIGAALLSHLETEGKTAVVIAPPRLVEYWQEVLAKFGAAKAKVFSSGKLDSILENEKYLNRKVVLVDESHHFRNPETQSYRDLAQICEGKEVILLSATPQNLSIWDIYWQIKLFTPYETNHNFRIYPIELKKYFDFCERGTANIEDLIVQIFIRRTRSDIKEYYQDEKIIFPKRNGPYRIDYSIDKVYPGGLYNRLKQDIKNLTYARYNLGKYAIPEEFDDPDELQRLTVAWANLQRLVQINLYRRLESSVKALKDTLSNHVKIHQAFEKILKEQNKIFVGDITDIEKIITALENGEDIDFESDEFYDAKKFKVNELLKDLNKDINTFKSMEAAIKDISAKDDDKLNKLVEILSKDPIRGKKVIIFSSFESTVKYLYEYLKNKFDKVDYITGGEKILTKIKRFAPKANDCEIRPEEQIQILVATEVLAEGLNLQDGQVVINYELHWNPVRIIQRIGRIDRIGSENDEIFVYNFFPETAAEKEINVNIKVNNRIDEIIQNFGYDEKTIRIDEPTVRKKLFEIYTEKPESMDDKEDRSDAKYFELEFRKLQNYFPEEYQAALRLPAMVNIARPNQQKGIVVFCRADDYYRLRLADTQGNIINSNDWQILKLLECKVDTPGQAFNKGLLKIVENIRKEFEVEANKREADKIIITEPIKNEFINLIKWLKRKETNDVKQRFDKLLDFVIGKQLNYENSKFIRSICRSYKKKFGLKKQQLLEELENQIYERLKNAPQAIRPEPTPKYAQIIVSEELI